MIVLLRRWFARFRADRDASLAVLQAADDPPHGHLHEHVDGTVHRHAHDHRHPDHEHDHAPGEAHTHAHEPGGAPHTH